MDKKRTKMFRDKLLARRESLVRQVAEAESASRNRAQEATPDSTDVAANAYANELSISMSVNDRKLLKLFDEALARIETGDYGECVRCGEPVQDKRLEAIPWARHCLRCQDMQERGLLTEED